MIPSSIRGKVILKKAALLLLQLGVILMDVILSVIALLICEIYIIPTLHPPVTQVFCYHTADSTAFIKEMGPSKSKKQSPVQYVLQFVMCAETNVHQICRKHK